MGWPLEAVGPLKRSPFKFRAAAKSLSIFSVSFRPSIRRAAEGGRFSRLVTFADQTFADRTFADRTFADRLSQYLIIKAL